MQPDNGKTLTPRVIPDPEAPEEQTRYALVSTALRLFAEEGPNAVSIRRITAEAGAANQSAVHYHFENKLGLVRAVLDAVNERLRPLQEEAMAELGDIAAQRTATVKEIVGIGLSPYIYLFQESGEGQLAMRFLARLTWESGVEAQDLLIQKVRPYFLGLTPFLQAALPSKALEALDFQLYMAAANIIHGLAEITVLAREPDSRVDRLYRERQQDLLRYFYAYISAGLASPDS
jgi:AcrR family transcriptional regulator